MTAYANEVGESTRARGVRCDNQKQNGGGILSRMAIKGAGGGATKAKGA